MKYMDINKGWEFNHGLNSAMNAGFSGATVEKKMVDLPHDAMITAKRSPEAKTGPMGAFFEAENCEYTKTLFWPEENAEKAAYLDFDGILGNATILVNGDYVGSCHNGYKNFQLQVNDYLVPGQDNLIKVIVKNDMQQNSRWYSGAGIYREVRLYVADALYILPDGVKITTLSADSEIAAINVETNIRWEGIGSRTGAVLTEIFDDSGQKACEASAEFNIMSGATLSVRQRIYIENPVLWNVGEGNRYRCESRLVIEGKNADEESTMFGVRTISLDSRKGLRINGKAVKLKGGCVHHDNGLLGAASYEDAELRKVSMLKEAGYNALRGAHNPMSRAFLSACDKLGMVVMEEYTDVWTHCKADFDYGFFLPDFWEKDLEDIVRRDYNHPSIILYSIGNEIPETGSQKAALWGRKIAEKLRNLDSTRLITNGVNIMMSVIDRIGIIMNDIGMEMTKQGYSLIEINDLMNNTAAVMPKVVSHPLAETSTNESFDLLDVIGLNYAEQAAVEQHERNPHRIYVGSETLPGKLDTNWELVENHSHIIGDFSWTAWDYLGEVGVGRIEELKSDGREAGAMTGFMGDYPWIAAYTGDFDLTGFRRPVSYWRETVWNGRDHQPYIAVQNPFHRGKKMFRGNWCWTDSLQSWTWNGAEDRDICVEVYADADEVELFINGKSLGRKNVMDSEKKYYFSWETTYVPGTLCAVSYVKDKEAGRSELKTAGEPGICMKADKTKIRKGSNELVFIEIELRDENQTIQTAQDRMLRLRLDGPGRLLASGSGNPCMEESYEALEHKTFQGRMLAIIKAGDEAGKIRLTASCESLTDVTVEIEQEI